MLVNLWDKVATLQANQIPEFQLPHEARQKVCQIFGFIIEAVRLRVGSRRFIKLKIEKFEEITNVGFVVKFHLEL